MKELTLFLFCSSAIPLLLLIIGYAIEDYKYYRNRKTNK